MVLRIFLFVNVSPVRKVYKRCNILSQMRQRVKQLRQAAKEAGKAETHALSLHFLY